jgi:hypothetical protein
MSNTTLTELVQATRRSVQAIAEHQQLIERRTEQELAVVRTERDLLLRRVAVLEAAHSELQRTRSQLGDALRRAARAENDAMVARSRLTFRGAKMLLRMVRSLSPGRNDLLAERGKGVVLVDLVGWPEDDLESALDRLAKRRDVDGTVMILLTDSVRFDLFRQHDFVFEYLSGNGAEHAERVAELSIAYRVDKVLVAERDGGLRPVTNGTDTNGGQSAETAVA